MPDNVTSIGLKKKYTLDRFSDELKSRKSHANKSRLPQGQSGMNGLYAKYRANARHRNTLFNLSKQEFKTITSKDCHYCGIAPIQEYFSWNKRMTKEGAAHSLYKYNGIDRVDSTKPYEMSNVLPCCGFCNRSKNKYTYEQFVAWINKAYHNLNTRKAG